MGYNSRKNASLKGSGNRLVTKCTSCRLRSDLNRAKGLGLVELAAPQLPTQTPPQVHLQLYEADAYDGISAMRMDSEGGSIEK